MVGISNGRSPTAGILEQPIPAIRNVTARDIVAKHIRPAAQEQILLIRELG